MKMMRKKQASWGIIITLILGFAIVIVLASSYFLPLTWKKQGGLTRLLAETDYQALLEGCRELSNRVIKGDLKPGQYWVSINREPRITRLPQVIIDLEPLFVQIDTDGRVSLEMGGIPYYGVVAYPDSNNKDYNFPGYTELIPGLWFYSEDYPGKYADYDKKINSLIQKGKMRHTDQAGN
jgi:hypothetical protein